MADLNPSIINEMSNKNFVYFLLLFVSINSHSQVKPISSQTKDLLDAKSLMGKWYAERDAQYKIIFDNGNYIELYGKDTIEIRNYKLSSSCNLNDNFTTIKLQQAYLIIYSKHDKMQDCNEILNLNKHILCWINNTNGKILVFRKFK